MSVAQQADPKQSAPEFGNLLGRVAFRPDEFRGSVVSTEFLWTKPINNFRPSE